MATVALFGWLDFQDQDSTEILRQAHHLIKSVYQEEGCIHYVWTVDVMRAGRVWVFEEWESVATLSAHLNGPAYEAMAEFLRTAGLSGGQVDKYRIDRKEPIYDGTGTAQPHFSDEVLAS